MRKGWGGGGGWIWLKITGSLSAFPLTRAPHGGSAEVVVELRPLLEEDVEDVPLAHKGQEHPHALPHTFILFICK
jgi:hypothetical protein